MFKIKKPWIEGWFIFFQNFICIWMSRINDRPIREDNSHRMEGVVGIVQNTTTHTTGIIRHNTTDETRIYWCRIGANLTIIFF